MYNFIKSGSIILLLILLFTALFVTFPSCDNGPTEPEIEPGRRDYTWEVDTLDIPFTYFWRIWGSDPKNVWIVGPGGGLDRTIYYYDGEKWNNDGISRAISPLSIWGFSKNDVWIAGYEGQIWHYNGNDWSESERFETTIEKEIAFIDLWGESPDNLYAIGSSGYGEKRTAVIAKYDGINWTMKDFTQLERYSFGRIRQKNLSSNKFYLSSTKDLPLTGDLDGFFECKTDTNIVKIYEGKSSLKTGTFLQKIDGEIYFVIGNTINKYVNNSFKKIFEVTLPNFGIQIHGRTAKDIFLRMTDGIAHYNGNDFKYLYKFKSRVSFTDAVVFEKEIFVLADDLTNGVNLVFRGKLIE